MKIESKKTNNIFNTTKTNIIIHITDSNENK